MNIGTHAEKCLSYIKCDLNSPRGKWFPDTKMLPAITLSRQAGCNVKAVANELLGLMQGHEASKQREWMILDRNLVEKVLEEHELPRQVAKYMPEDRVSAIQGAVEEMLGLHPSARTMVQQTAETISHLARLGHVILIGRGANVITQDMRNVFHVRLVAPVDVRVERIMARNHLDLKAARDYVRKSDLARKRYVKDHFHADIDDFLRYDLVINTARLSYKAVAEVIADAFVHWARAQ